MRYFKSAINRKVLAITLVPAALVAVLLTLSSSIVQTSAMEMSLSERGLAIVRQLAPACEYGVYSANQDILRPLVESVMKEHDVVVVEVRDANGKVLIRGGNEKNVSANIDFTSTKPGILKLDQIDTWSFYAPIYQSEYSIADFSDGSDNPLQPAGTLRFTDRILGWVSVELSTSEMRSVKTGAWINTAVIATAVLTIGGLLALLMGRGITNPITQLMVAVNKVEKGHLDIHIDTGASGELKSLELGINNMVRALSLSREELETKIDKATEDLRIVLEDLAQKNKELESSRLDAENANREKSAFLANISHEIRTPLHGAKGFMQLMSETKLQDEQKLYLDRINSSIKALSSLLNDILDFSRLEVSKLKLEYGEFDVSPLLDDIVTMYAWEANEKEIELVTIVDRNIPLCLYGSGDRISQVLRNLVSNAVKYTAEGEIIIRLEKVVQAGASQYRFSVTDTGIGIPPEERGRLFQPFSQIESGMRKNYGGVGLGLVISKALVELMGGRIYVNSIEDVGTCFSVELCLHACEASAVKAASFESAGSMPCWILSPNDNIQASLLQTFLRWGAQAETGGALPSNHERLPQLICASKATTLVIVDGLFSDTRIMAFLKLLEQRTSGHRAVPVLLETANGCAERERLCRYFNYRLTRPLNSQEVETLVRRVHETGQVPGWIQPSPEKAMHQIALDHFPENILLVDDNVINREFLDIWMSKAGIAVDQAKNGIEAIKACEDGTYGLILMDLHMPGMDGFQAIEAIKSGSTANRNSRIIAITADATEETIERIGATGFDGYLIKPVTQESLLAALSEDRVDRPVDIQSPQDTDRYSVADSHIVDEAEGLRLASGNRDIWRWSLKTLAQRLPDYRERLRLAVENREHEELSKVLHAIQGAASYCGAMDLLSAINRLQTKVKDEQNMEFSKEYSAFLDSMTAFINWVSQQELE